MIVDTVKSLIVMVTVVDFEPTELLAHIVKTSPDTTTVGVPQIVPLLLPKFMPSGSVGSISHELIEPLVLVLVSNNTDSTVCCTKYPSSKCDEN